MTGPESLNPRYHVRHFIVAPLGRDRKNRIAVTSTHDVSYACQIALLDTNGTILRKYWHSGHLSYLAAADLHGRGWNELVVAGINNDYKTSTLLVLDPDHFTGASTERPEYQLQDLPVPVECARVLFPRSCINETLEPFTTLTKLNVDATGINVEVQHRLSPADATLFYDLDHSLKVRKVEVGSSFERAHLALHATRVINHNLTGAETKTFEALTYLTQPATPYE